MGDLSLESMGRKECVKIAEDIEHEMAHGIMAEDPLLYCKITQETDVDTDGKS